MSEHEYARVLSIQSHVVSGYVGNKSAVFPMQLLGLEVDFINSVQFSTHTQYETVKGQVLNEKDLADLMEALSSNNIHFYSYLLTGYIGTTSFLKQVATVVKQLKEKNPNLAYVCDPVMGDNGKLYVPEVLIPIYRDYIIPLATIITPNLFEAQILSEIKIENVADVWRSIELLHRKGCQTVVISSAELEHTKDLCVFASAIKEEGVERYTMEIEKLPISFTGTGDLFAALFLSWMHKSGRNVKESLEKTIASLQAVLRRTMESMKGKEVNVRNKELKLIQSKCDIEEPKIIYKATRVR